MFDYVLLEEYAQNKKVLFVEDDKHIIKETKEFLELIFKNEIDIALNGKEGFEKYLEYKNRIGKYYDLVITDIQMPILNGIEFTKLVYKENTEQLLIVLSAHSESNYLLELVNIGISHFITKPLNHDEFVHVLFTKLEELNKKLNSLEKNDHILPINDKLTWDRNKKLLSFDSENIKLTKKELALLDLLLKQVEQTHTVEEILNKLWADDENNAPDIKNLKNIISRLRKKIPTLNIENVYGFGYRILIK